MGVLLGAMGEWRRGPLSEAGREGGSERERGREGKRARGRAPLSAHTFRIDFARVPTTCRNTLRVRGAQQFRLNAGYCVACGCWFLVFREGSGGKPRSRGGRPSCVSHTVHARRQTNRKERGKKNPALSPRPCLIAQVPKAGRWGPRGAAQELQRREAERERVAGVMMHFFTRFPDF